ncbi:MAG TPA: tetratricopeptide repeat protein [Spirochaetia bacterium]|nr:tetratricopeptide repeat protein [Spirochaetales bacterium]HRS65371.1 tetratricopeptide repeat protein [Spirochaetia bacterium]HOT59939.1 tetratricopeptide repeat protein [Spirochaetales bacterium]HPD80499.1 tetratricopeptide repeat protein [Spirochaetales bacterium]HQK33713.1 tetratricopeptide repeat protein [Spirochaetales bacterium]
MKKVYCMVGFFLLVSCSYSNQKQLEQYAKAYDSYIHGNLADPVLESYIHDPGDFVPGLILKGKVYFIKGDFSSAEKAFERALALRPSSIEGKIWYARTLYYKSFTYNEKNLEKVISKIHSILVDVLSDNPDSINAHALLAMIAKDKKEYDLQIEHLTRIIQYSDELAYALLERARAFWIQNKIESAQKDLTLALALSQNNAGIQSAIREILSRIEKQGEKNE